MPKAKEPEPRPSNTERPRARRYPFAATAELTDLRSEAKVLGQSIDLSLYGCGVKAQGKFEIGTHVRIRITHKGQTWAAFGKVVRSNEKGEMGISFTRIEKESGIILEKWLDDLRKSLPNAR